MDHDHYSDALIGDVLRSTRTIAMLGASPNEDRPSNHVMAFLLSRGFRVIPLNPGQAGKAIHGQLVYADLASIPDAIDMVDVFRPASALPGIADEILALPALPKYVWTQLEIRDDAVAARLEKNGITVIQNRCPAIEIPRLARLGV
jgi:uncharacterized protein